MLRDAIVTNAPVWTSGTLDTDAVMEIMGRFRNQTTTERNTADDGHFVLIETDDHEQIVLAGSSDDEMQAKLDDFLTWAS